jgi:hypothetical protein
VYDILYAQERYRSAPPRWRGNGSVSHPGRRFETAPRLAAWAGVAPGNDESAGKQRSGKTRKGNHPLQAIPTQLAHAAVRTKGTYVSALYQRLAARRGKKRAIIAVAHSIMVSIFHMLSRNVPYRELGANYFDERRRHYTVDRLTRRIEHLGYRVYLEPLPTIAACEIFKATLSDHISGLEVLQVVRGEP